LFLRLLGADSTNKTNSERPLAFSISFFFHICRSSSRKHFQGRKYR
jgi:hypothetical protein